MPIYTYTYVYIYIYICMPRYRDIDISICRDMSTHADFRGLFLKFREGKFTKTDFVVVANFSLFGTFNSDSCLQRPFVM